MGVKKLKYVDGNMFQYEIYDLVDKYNPILYKPTEEYKFRNNSELASFITTEKFKMPPFENPNVIFLSIILN
jgi:hypothetical protein